MTDFLPAGENQIAVKSIWDIKRNLKNKISLVKTKQSCSPLKVKPTIKIKQFMKEHNDKMKKYKKLSPIRK